MTMFEHSLADRVDQAIQTNPYVNGRLLRFETEGAHLATADGVGSDCAHGTSSMSWYRPVIGLFSTNGQPPSSMWRWNSSRYFVT